RRLPSARSSRAPCARWPLPDRSLAHLQVAPVREVGGARALGGHHRGAERRVRRALPGEGGAVARLLDPAQYLPADTERGLAGFDVLDLEAALRVVVAVFVAQPVAALG